MKSIIFPREFIRPVYKPLRICHAAYRSVVNVNVQASLTRKCWRHYIELHNRVKGVASNESIAKLLCARRLALRRRQWSRRRWADGEAGAFCYSSEENAMPIGVLRPGVRRIHENQARGEGGNAVESSGAFC